MKLSIIFVSLLVASAAIASSTDTVITLQNSLSWERPSLIVRLSDSNKEAYVFFENEVYKAKKIKTGSGLTNITAENGYSDEYKVTVDVKFDKDQNGFQPESCSVEKRGVDFVMTFKCFRQSPLNFTLTKVEPEAELVDKVAKLPTIYGDSMQVEKLKVTLGQDFNDKLDWELVKHIIRSRDWAVVDGWYYDERYESDAPRKYLGKVFNRILLGSQYDDDVKLRVGNESMNQTLSKIMSKTYVRQFYSNEAKANAKQALEEFLPILVDKFGKLEGWTNSGDSGVIVFNDGYTSGQSVGNTHQSTIIWDAENSEVYHFRFTTYEE